MKVHRLAAAAAALFLAAGIALAEDVTLEYHLTISRPETGVGRVEMTVSGLESKGFRLLRASAAAPAWFDAVKAHDAAADDKQFQVEPVESGFYITTGGAKSVAITYDIKPGEIGDVGHVGIITAGYAALDGSMLFLAPGDEQTVKDVAFTFAVPPSWHSVIAWKQAQGAYHPDASFAPINRQLARSLVCFGDFVEAKKPVGTNTLVIHTLSSYSKADADSLAQTLAKIYSRIYDVLGFETSADYHVVCLPPAPDGMVTVAGAWVDGQALSLSGMFDTDTVTRCTRLYGRFIMDAYFGEPPYGVNLSGDDRWLYPAVLVYGEGLAAIESQKVAENLFYGLLYTGYADEASQEISALDVPFAKMDKAPSAARAFLANYKAPLLLMRLDFEIRANAAGLKIDDFLKALYRKSRDEAAGANALTTLAELTNTDFTPFYDTFVRDRALILPTWPAFIDSISSQKAEPGPVVAKVDGAPVYQREVQIMNDAILQDGLGAGAGGSWATATSLLVDEKLMDEALAAHKLNVIPEAFWRLRLVLPPKVMTLMQARKRQALRDALYQDWVTKSHQDSSIVIERSEEPKLTAPQAAPQQPSVTPSPQVQVLKPAR